jgi:putative DNA primase/helicase
MNTELAVQARGRWPDILHYHGIPREFLRNRHGPCPICSGTNRFRFDDKNGTGSYYCGGCGSGDGVSLLMKFCGFDFKTAATEVRKIIGQCKMNTTAAAPDTAKNEARLKKIHAGLQRITADCLAAKYFAGRGITVLPETGCFFHPGIDYYQDGKSIGKYPAIVSMFRNLAGEISTFHITYLSADGKKLDVESPRKILPVIRPMHGGAVRLFKCDDILGISEGIESGLSANQLDGIPVWATTSAGLMIDVKIPESVKHVVIYGDNDKNRTGRMAAETLANRLILREKKTVDIFYPEYSAESSSLLTYKKSEGINKDMNDCLIASCSQ